MNNEKEIIKQQFVKLEKILENIAAYSPCLKNKVIVPGVDAIYNKLCYLDSDGCVLQLINNRQSEDVDNDVDEVSNTISLCDEAFIQGVRIGIRESIRILKKHMKILEECENNKTSVDFSEKLSEIKDSPCSYIESYQIGHSQGYKLGHSRGQQSALEMNIDTLEECLSAGDYDDPIGFVHTDIFLHENKDIIDENGDLLDESIGFIYSHFDLTQRGDGEIFDTTNVMKAYDDFILANKK